MLGSRACAGGTGVVMTSFWPAAGFAGGGHSEQYHHGNRTSSALRMLMPKQRPTAARRHVGIAPSTAPS